MQWRSDIKKSAFFHWRGRRHCIGKNHSVRCHHAENGWSGSHLKIFPHTPHLLPILFISILLLHATCAANPKWSITLFPARKLQDHVLSAAKIDSNSITSFSQSQLVQTLSLCLIGDVAAVCCEIIVSAWSKISTVWHNLWDAWATTSGLNCLNLTICIFGLTNVRLGYCSTTRCRKWFSERKDLCLCSVSSKMSTNVISPKLMHHLSPKFRLCKIFMIQR